MKIFYFAVIAFLLTVVTTVHTQAQTSDVSTFRTGKANEPIIGIGVAIPLRKLFGSGKRVKLLPKQPESVSPLVTVEFSEPNEIPSQDPKQLESNLLPLLDQSAENVQIIESVEVLSQDSNQPGLTSSRMADQFDEYIQLIKPVSDLSQNKPSKAKQKGTSTKPNIDLPPLNSVQCFQTYHVVSYWDGTETRTPVGDPWCVNDGESGETLDPSDREPVGGGDYAETPQQKKQRECRECMTFAQNEYSSAKLDANSKIWTRLGLTAGTAAGIYVSTNSTNFWLNFLPVVGPQLAQGLAVAVTLGFAIPTLFVIVTEYNATINAIDNNLYKNTRDCGEKFCN